MSRALAFVFAFLVASCAHVVPPAPLPPQPPEEASPIIIINARAERPAPHAAQTPLPKKRAPIATATPDVVAIGWSLRDTLVWDGRSAARQAIHRVPRRQSKTKSGTHDFVAMQCGDWNRVCH